MRLNKTCLLFFGIHLLFVTFVVPAEYQGKTDSSPDWFYPEWAVQAKYNKPILVRDTDSALGRYSLKTKEIGLKDLARIHGHLCDGLVISFIEISAALERLFPDGIVDRTDLRAVAKNGPCWVDAAAMMTGARINFKTLRIDNSTGDGFIIQRVSTKKALAVHLKPDVFPAKQAALEEKIRNLHTEGKPVNPQDIDALEKMADDLSRRLLSTSPQEILDIRPLPGYVFSPSDLFGERGDIITKDVPRSK